MLSGENQKTALLIGGSYSAVPIAELIQSFGIRLLILTGNPKEPATYFADGVIVADYSDHQESLKALESENFDYVVPTCNDASYLLGARLAEMYGLPGFDNFKISNLISSKREFRDLTTSMGIPAPISFSESELYQGFNRFPVIIKPNVSFSGRGISIVREPSQLMEAIEHARSHSKHNSFAIESYIEGSLHSISAFIRDGVIETSFVVDEFCTIYPFQVNNSNFPSQLSDEIKNKAISNLNRIITEITLVDGLVHLQFLAHDNEAYFIELMRRCPGDLYGHFFKYSLEFDYYKSYLSTFLGNTISDEPPKSSKSEIIVARSTETSSYPRIFLSIATECTEAVIFPLAISGDMILPAPFGKTAIVFFLLSTMESFQKLYPDFDSALKVSFLRIGE